MARMLIVGCGCRGRALAAALDEHAVRGTTRSVERLSRLESAGVEGVVADPDRLATLVPALSGVTVVCWLMGSAVDSPAVNGARLASLVEHLVDTPVRGIAYEAAGAVEATVLATGAQIVLEASRRWHMPAAVVETDPASHAEWVEAMREAVESVLRA